VAGAWPASRLELPERHRKINNVEEASRRQVMCDSRPTAPRLLSSNTVLLRGGQLRRVSHARASFKRQTAFRHPIRTWGNSSGKVRTRTVATLSETKLSQSGDPSFVILPAGAASGAASYNACAHGYPEKQLGPTTLGSSHRPREGAKVPSNIDWDETRRGGRPSPEGLASVSVGERAR